MKQLIKKDRAVVIGASIAGLLTAKVLSNHFNEVIVIERDKLLDEVGPRRGVPQSYQSHFLIKGGELVIEELFPGIVEELKAEGSQSIDVANDMAWMHHGKWKLKFQSNYTMIYQTRPFLEFKIRNKLKGVTNVTFREKTKVITVNFDPKIDQVSNIIISNKNGEKIELNCNLLVDATGAGSRCLSWLKKSNYELPKESKLKIDLAYATRFYEWSKETREKLNIEWKALVMSVNPPHQTTVGLMVPSENNTLGITIGGYLDHPPTDEEGFLSFMKKLDSPIFYDIAKDLKPASDVYGYKFPEQRRRYFEKLKKFPSNFLVLGDAFCRLDPAFAQGMTVAAKEVMVLDDQLKNSKEKGNFAIEFHKGIAKVVDAPWNVTCLESFRMKHVEGEKPSFLKLKLWFLKKILHLTTIDKKIYLASNKVTSLREKPSTLFKPYIIFNIIKLSLSELFFGDNKNPKKNPWPSVQLSKKDN